MNWSKRCGHPATSEVFDGWKFCTGTPGWQFICAECGETAVRVQKERPKNIDRKRFIELCRIYGIEYRE